jgi:hypothetical protein
MKVSRKESKLNILSLGMFCGIVTLVVDSIIELGEFRPMIASAILLSAPAYFGIINPGASLVGAFSLWVWIPLKRLFEILLSPGVVNVNDSLFGLLEFSVVSLLLCLSGLTSSLIARKLSKAEYGL